MPAATNKKELLAACEKEFAKLLLVLERVSAKLAVAKQADDTSIKDVIVHRAHWIDLYLKWYADGAAGREVHIPAKGYKWSELKAYNATIREKNAKVSWAAAQKRLIRAHEKLTTFLRSKSNAALYNKPMVGHHKWSPGRFAESAGASHYRSAAKFVRAALR